MTHTLACMASLSSISGTMCPSQKLPYCLSDLLRSLTKLHLQAAWRSQHEPKLEQQVRDQDGRTCELLAPWLP
jgi:hypothetical protein